MTYYGAPQRGSSMTTWVVGGILIVVGVIGMVTLAAVLSRSDEHRVSNSRTSTTSSPNIPCPQGFVPPSKNPDCYFLNMLQTRNISSPDGQPGLIRQAHQICTAMDQAAAAGQTPSAATFPLIRHQHPELSISDAAFFSSITMAAYCPWNMRQ